MLRRWLFPKPDDTGVLVEIRNAELLGYPMALKRNRRFRLSSLVLGQELSEVQIGDEIETTEMVEKPRD